MPKVVTLFAVLAVAVAGCSEDKKKDGPPATPSGGSSSKSPPTTTKPAPASAAKLDCDKILPQALRDKYFKDAKISDNPQPTDFTAECKIDDGSPAGGSISVSCNEHMAAVMESTIAGMKESMDATDLPGVGKAAISVSMGEAGSMVSAWDDDSDCQTTMAVPSSIDAATFAKDVLAVLPVK